MALRRRSQAAGSTDAAAPEPATPDLLGNGLHLHIREPEIPAILEQVRAQNLPADEGVYRVDWAGVRTRIPMLPWAP